MSGHFFVAQFIFLWPSQMSAVTPSVQATGDCDGNLCISCSQSVEVLLVVQAGVIKLLEYPPDRQGYNWLPQNCLQKNEKILSTSTSPGRNFAVNGALFSYRNNGVQRIRPVVTSKNNTCQKGSRQ